MLYKSDNETIVYNHEDGVNISKIIHSSTKADIFSRLHARLKNYKHEVEPNFNYYNEVANSVTSIMTRCPMILNMMVTRGYKDVLFVGYYHQGRSMDWLLDQSSDKIIDDIPFVTRNLEYVMDFKNCLQFLPVIAKLYGYNINFTCVRPPEERHRGAIDWVYQKEGIKQVDGNKQYKFGSESFTIPHHDPTENEGRKYDAFKSLIKEAVKEAIQEELKEVLIEAVKAPKQSFVPQPVNETLPKASPQVSEDRRAKYANILGETAAQFTSQDVQRFNPQGTMPGGDLPKGDLGMDQIMGLLSKK